MGKSWREKKVQEDYQPKGNPKPGRKVSKPKVTEDDMLSLAHKQERGDFKGKGGRA